MNSGPPKFSGPRPAPECPTAQSAPGCDDPLFGPVDKRLKRRSLLPSDGQPRSQCLTSAQFGWRGGGETIEIINIITLEEASRLKIENAANGGQIQVPDIKWCSDWLI